MTSIDLYVRYFLNYFALDPQKVWTQYYIWQLFTYIFPTRRLLPHSFQPFSLWMFGGETGNYWGSRRFLFYFFFCGIGAGIFTVLLPLILSSEPPGRSMASFSRLAGSSPIGPFTSISFSRSLRNTWSSFRSHRILFIRFREGGCRSSDPSGWPRLRALFMAYPVIRQKLRREYYKRKWSQRGPGGGGHYH